MFPTLQHCLFTVTHVMDAQIDICGIEDFLVGIEEGFLVIVDCWLG